ncbi:hypothetical protein [Streptomyces shenzhenensis]|uniref:hypothetical protein n=1 Tax=Streptomyces shenzhenensis TaxID=943815 RepID=UPI001F2B2D7A|nr:hypothetical protein [Streptomyces shenzhenensis]
MAVPATGDDPAAAALAEAAAELADEQSDLVGDAHRVRPGPSRFGELRLAGGSTIPGKALLDRGRRPAPKARRGTGDRT